MPTMIDGGCGAILRARTGLAVCASALMVLACCEPAVAQTPAAALPQIQAVQHATGQPSVTAADLSSPERAALAARRTGGGQGAASPAAVAAPQTVTPAQADPRAASGLPPFGARLFAQPDTPSALPLSDGQHVLAPGDEVRIMIWGGYTYDAVLKIQKDGTVFLPFAGVLRLAGLREAELSAAVQRRAAAVFTQNVQVSAALQSASPVRIYVTGYAVAPGIYEGYPGEGVYAFVKRAGGVDALRGAYSDVRILRGGKPVARMDLYDLVARGEQPSLALQSGDTIHVGIRGGTITLRGDVTVEAEYEIGTPPRTLGELADLAGVHATANQVRIERQTDGVRTAELMALSDPGWRERSLRAGDAVAFSRAQRTESIYVRLTGEYEGSSEMVLPRGATLADALAQIRPTPWSRLGHSYVVREDIRQAQLAYKSAAARQIEQTILGARSASVDEARLRKEEADLLLDWVKRLERYDVRGALVAADQNPAAVYLAAGDTIEIPSTRAPVFVVGDVFSPMALQRADAFRAADYLRLAGVDTARSELRYFIQEPNGVVRTMNGLDAQPGPGDQIFVLPAVDAKTLQGSKDILQIIYQLAVSAKIIFGL